MKSIYYITILIGLGSLTLTGCAEAPIAKTNCWSGAGTTVTTSTKGASPDVGIVSQAAPSGLDVIPCL